VWDEEGRYPDVIFEFLSPSTRRSDQTTKKTLYEQTFRTREYYWYDPFDPQVLQGWQLHPDHGYQAMTPDARGWLWSPALQLWIGRWDGTYARDHTTWVRWYDPAGRLVLTAEELAVVAEQRAAVAEQRAVVAEQRAEAAEAELARLRARLAQLGDEGTEASD
jgi:hypothetical protein